MKGIPGALLIRTGDLANGIRILSQAKVPAKESAAAGTIVEDRYIGGALIEGPSGLPNF